jgi:Family of unknown function (DUF5694)
MKIKVTLLFCLVLFSVNNFAQNRTFNPNDILQANRKLPEVLLVGTFHFAYQNLDVYKTEKDKQVDILSPERQKEVEELVDYISKFKPTKIVVEIEPNDTTWINRYQSYKAGKRKLGRNEVEQISFRLLDKFNLNTLYGADASAIFYDLYYSKDSTILRPTLDSIFSGWQNYKYKCEDPVCKLQDSLNNYQTELSLQWTLLEFFKYLNTDKALNSNYGSYFDGEYFTQGEFRGADALALEWYDRNLRIFRNIQRITTSPDDRILVLFGQGHVSILKHLFECAPNYKLVKFDELKNSR